MEDAIDDWLLRQIHWLRREDTIAQGIRWLQDVRIDVKLQMSFTGSGTLYANSGMKLLVQIQSKTRLLGCQ